MEDCGDVRLSVKIRVMPKCWFVLLRLYLRIDGGVIRVRDTRLYHTFESDDYIYMDVTWHEVSFERIYIIDDDFV